MSKKVLATKINAIFLATVLIVGTFALMSQSFMNNAQAEPGYDKPQQYPSYKPDYDYKSKDTINIKKVNCNNVNLNVNDVSVNNNVGRPPVGDFTTLDTPLSETGEQEITANNFANGERKNNNNNGFMKDNNGFVYVCINNNNNAGQQETSTEQPTEPPTEPPVEELATLQITKAVPCFTTGTGQEDVCRAIFAAITPDLFDITVSGNNPNPSNFEGSGTQTLVTIGPGTYQISETPDSSLSTIISNLETTQNAEISGPQSIFNGDCTKQGDHFAIGTIAEGETQACIINNAFTVESVTIPE